MAMTGGYSGNNSADSGRVSTTEAVTTDLQHEPEHNWGWFVIIVIAFALGASIYFGWNPFDWLKRSPPEPLNATFVFEKAIFDALPITIHQRLEPVNIQIEQLTLNNIVRPDGGGGGEPPKSSCNPQPLRLVLAVGGIDLICEIANASLKQLRKSSNTIIVDAVKDKVIVHTMLGGTGSVLIVRKDKTEQFSTDFSHDDIQCPDLIGKLTKLVPKL